MRTAAELIEETNAVDESATIEAKAGSEVGQYHLPAAQSHQSGAQSRELGGQSREVGLESRDPDASLTTQDLPEDLRGMVAGLSRRPKEEALRGVIRAICDWRPVTSAQLARLLDRRQDALVRDHLRPMVEAGQLRYTIPAMPNHPNQAYAAQSEEEAE